MKDFLAENWLPIIGALAWLPILINIFVKLLRKIHCVYLDKDFIFSATAHLVHHNGVSTQKTGMVFMMALNLSIYNQSFFSQKITCTLKLNKGPKHKASLYVGSISYNDPQDPHETHFFDFPEAYDIDLHRTIYANQDNVRVLPFFFENLNMKNDENIKKIIIRFKGSVFQKKIRIKNSDCSNHKVFALYNK